MSFSKGRGTLKIYWNKYIILSFFANNNKAFEMITGDLRNIFLLINQSMDYSLSLNNREISNLT